MKDLEKAMFTGQISKLSVFNVNNINVSKAYIDPYIFYSMNTKQNFDKFILTKKYTKCSSLIEDFNEYFILNNINFTIYSHLNSFDINIFSSGLAISIFDSSIDRNKILKDNYFRYFNFLCKKHKFMICKDSSNILIYKLSSNYDFNDYENINETYIEFLNIF